MKSIETSKIIAEIKFKDNKNILIINNPISFLIENLQKNDI